MQSSTAYVLHTYLTVLPCFASLYNHLFISLTHSLRRRNTVRNVSFKILLTTVYKLSIYKTVI